MNTAPRPSRHAAPSLDMPTREAVWALRKALIAKREASRSCKAATTHSQKEAAWLRLMDAGRALMLARDGLDDALLEEG